MKNDFLKKTAEKIRNSPIAVPACIFGCYMFCYTTMLTVFNMNSTGYIAEDMQIRMYYIDTLCIAAGFLLYAAYHRFTKTDKMPFGVITAFVLVFIMAFVLPESMLFMYMAPLLSLFAGFLGGYVYYVMSVQLAVSPVAGKAMAIGNSTAVLLQVILQFACNLYMKRILSIDLMIVVGFLVFHKELDEMTELAGKAAVETEKPVKFDFLMPCLVITGLTFVLSYFDHAAETLQIASQYQDINLYSWPRLLLCVSLLLFGWAHDQYRGKYDNLMVLAAAAVSMINPVLLHAGDYLIFGTYLFYLALGIEIAFMNIRFWELASRSSHPALWASAGRVIDCLVLVVLPAFSIYSLPLPLMIILDIVIILCIMWMIMHPEKTAEPEHKDLSTDHFSETYHLTDREKEVLDQLIHTHLGVQEIADSLYISRRTLQRHMKAIFEKTDTENRIDLIQKLYRENDH